MFLALLLFILAVGVYVFSTEWRQLPRLVADGLVQPRGVVWMPDDSLVVAEAAGRLTWASASSTRATLVDGLPPGGTTGVARHPDGRLMVLVGACELVGCRAIWSPDPAGQLVPGLDLSALTEPWGFAIAADGMAYVSDAVGGTVVRVSSVVEPIAQLGPGAAPRGLAIAPDGSVHAALAGRGSVVNLQDGREVATGLDEPVAVGFEPDGRLLVLERGGRLLRLPGRDVLAEGLDQPTAMTVTPDGRVYVTTRGWLPGAPGQLLQIRRLGPIAPRRVV